ncbi:hypothetical protein D5289_09085 [Lactiplantibacillus plantarum]|nr:hypothetical protein D5289_09085 [Lactiplantibacillus plantarum]
MRKFYFQYHKQISSFININRFMLIFECILLFVIKGGIDLYNQMPYNWHYYLSLLIHYFLGTLAFFALLLIIECIWHKFHLQ